jgi:hypothetical protein
VVKQTKVPVSTAHMYRTCSSTLHSMVNLNWVTNTITKAGILSVDRFFRAFLGSVVDPDPVGWSLLRAEGFSCSLDILYGGRGISKWQFLIKRILDFFSAELFFAMRRMRGPHL